MSHQEITIKQLETIVQLNLANPMGWQPMVLLGPPGVAKTAFCRDVLPSLYAAHLGVDPAEVGYVEEHPASRDAAEQAGVALPSKDATGALITTFTKPPILSQIEATGLQYGVINADEIGSAGPAEVKVWRDLFDGKTHRMGGYRFPPGWIVVGTGNRPKDKADAKRLLAHLTNCVLVFEVLRDIPGWSKWALQHGVNPVFVECALAHDGSGFFAEGVPTEDVAFCSERSYERAAAHFTAYAATPGFTGTVEPLVERMLAACIGPEAASTVCQWIAQRDHVPTGAEILSDPEGCKVPEQTGFQLIAANIGMAEVHDAHSAEAVLRYIMRLRPDLQVSLGCKLFKVTTQNPDWIITDPAAARFVEKFHKLIPLAYVS